MSFTALGAVASWPRMEARARGLAYELADCHNAVTGLCCPSVAYLAKRLDTSERTIQRLLRNLEQLGVVECHARYDGQRQTTTSYAFSAWEGDKSVTGEGDKIVTGEGDKDDTIGGDKVVTQNQEEVIRKEEYIGNAAKPRGQTWKKPTVEEVSAYCQERQNSIDPGQFVDFYESKGWMVGKTKMKCWKSAVRTWERTDEKNRRTGGERADKRRAVYDELQDRARRHFYEVD